MKHPEQQVKLSRSFAWLNATQFLGALNDNIFKLLIIFALIRIQGFAAAGAISAKAGMVFVAPFLIFSAAAGILADRLSKQRLIVIAKILEVIVMAFGVLAFSLRSEIGLYLTLFLMAAQSTLFGPSKYGIVPELVEREQLSKANSLLETFTYLAIIIGTALAPFLAQATQGKYALAASSCIIIAIIGVFTCLRIEPTPPAGSTKQASFFFLKEIWETLKIIRADSYLLLAVSGAAYFMFLGAFAQVNLIPYGIESLGLTQEQSGYLFLAAALGIGAGSLLAGKLSGRNVEFGVVPLGALGLTLSCFALNFLATSLTSVVLFITLFGISAGLFIVPLYSFIQWRSPKKQLGEILAAANFLGWFGVLLAAGLAYIFSSYLKLSAASGFLVFGFLTLGLTITALWVLPDFLVRFLALIAMKTAYRIKVVGAQNVPAEGPALLLPNHVSWIDALLLVATQQRRIRFVMHREVYDVWYLKPIFKLMGVIPVSPQDSLKEKVVFINQVRAILAAGYMVAIFPEGAISRDGMLQEFQPGLEHIVKGTNCPLIPIYIGGVWGSIFSYVRNKMSAGAWSILPPPITIIFGQPLPATSKAEEVKQAVMELSSDYFNLRKSERKSLAEELILNARKHWPQPAIADMSGKSLNYGQTLTASIALAKTIKPRILDQEKIGILLPPSVGGALVNLALTLLGKIPVNLNYTAAPESVQSAIAQCQIKYIISSPAFLEKVPTLQGLPGLVYLEDILRHLSPRQKLSAWLQARFLPSNFLAPATKSEGDSLATIIFSSGSTGDPKGVMLTQHNILSNLEAARIVARINQRDNFCSALPFFHSLGFTGTLWLPLLSGASVTYHVNPLDGAKIAAAVRTHHSTILIATPTFLLNYIRRARPEDFASLRLVVTGAEKLKKQLADAFAEKFGLRPLEGYGATELSPLITLSLPDVSIDGVRVPGAKDGSVGRPIPGIAIKIVDPDTGRQLPTGEAGLIMVKGPNVMLGYLNRPEQTASVIQDGWYVTGDIGWLERDGFLVITDRIARFSKIGGEMVPHIRIEEEFQKSLNLAGQNLAVTAIPDESRGEKLVVLFTPEVGEVTILQDIISQSSLPNLWKPARDCYVQIEALPILGSGKLDLKKLRQLAQENLGSK